MHACIHARIHTCIYRWAALATELPVGDPDDVEAADLAKQLHASL